MTRTTWILTIALVCTMAFAGSAWACDTCGCRDAAAAEQGDKAGCAGCDGADCANCSATDKAACGCSAHASEPAHAHYHGVENLPDWHVASPADLHVTLQEVEQFDVAYLPGTFGDDMDVLFNELMAAADAQGLLSAETHAGAVLPGVQYSEPTDDTAIMAAIWIRDDAEVNAPIERRTIPGGYYMVVQHWGDYAQIGDTYMRAIGWATENGVSFPDRPSFVHHVNAADGAPVEEWLTEIYLPFEHVTAQTPGSMQG